MAKYLITNINSESKIDLENRSEIRFCTGSKYIGEWSPHGMNGKGVYTLPNGVKYNGEMFDGQFHGNGELCYPTGEIIQGSWFMGSLENVIKYIFNDGLEIDVLNWNYCNSCDRRFQECCVNGIPGVDETLILPRQLNETNSRKIKESVGAKRPKLFSFID